MSFTPPTSVQKYEEVERMSIKQKKKSNIFTIVKKELRRFFGDRRMIATIILPGVLIYTIYSLMGSTMMAELMGEEDASYTVYAENLPASVQAMTGELENLTYVTDVSDPKSAVAEGELDLYCVFPENFDALVAAYDPAAGQPAPFVEMYYNTSRSASSGAQMLVTAVLDGYESALANRFDVNPDPGVSYDLATSEDMTVMIFSMMMPMLLMMLMFSCCMSVAPDAIAGEKERGTIATLLVTPMPRWHLAIGKIISVSAVALLGGVCSFLGVVLSLPKLMGDTEMIDAAVYGIPEYACILGVILSTVLLFVSVISVISALAKSVKEASGMVTPLMFVILFISISGMFTGGSVPATPLMYLIPVFNSAQCISGIFSMTYEPLSVVLTVVSNLACTGVCVFALTKVFNSEKIMFNK